MKRTVFLVIAVTAIWLWWRDPPARWRGLPASKSPVQTSKELPPAFRYKDYTIVPLARYEITAVVLRRERYRFDAVAKLAPVDLALGWGPMSLASAINELRFTQHGRFYHYRWSNEPPLEVGQIVRHSANTHCLPANDAVRRDLLRVKRHELVTLEGFLVEVQMGNGGTWRSSLTRDDSQGGACEILWITGIARKPL